MAKDYYTQDEALRALGVSADQIRAMVADGRLQEFRDEGQVLYQKADVDSLASKLGSSVIDLNLDDDAPGAGAMEINETDSFASALSSLSDSTGEFGMLEDSAMMQAQSEAPAKPAAPAKSAAASGDSAATELEDLEIADLSGEFASLSGDETGMSSSIRLAPPEEEKPKPAPKKPAPAAASRSDMGLSGSSILSLVSPDDKSLGGGSSLDAAEGSGSFVGINVFEDEEVTGKKSDPMEETQVASGVVELDTGASGSGLLDLTREADDTSIGPDLMEVISPTEADTEAGTVVAEPVEDEAVGVAAPAEGESVGYEAPAVAAMTVTRPVAAMTGAGPLNFCMLVGVVTLGLLGLATAAQIQGVWPGFLNMVGGIKTPEMGSADIIHYSVFGGLAVIALALGIVSSVAKGK